MGCTVQVRSGKVLSPKPGGHKTTRLKTLFVTKYVHDITSPSPGRMFVTVNFQVACVRTDSTCVLKLQ